MKTALLVLGLTIGVVYSSIVPIRSEKKVADATHLKKQKQILDLYLGVGHYDDYLNHDDFHYDVSEDIEKYSDHEAVHYFWNAYKQGGYLPKHGVFTMSCPHTKKNTIALFDVFYFAKDFDTFFKAASWAKKHLHAMQFYYAYTLALIHREDCENFFIPPLYEIFPTYFVPHDTFHKAQTDRLYGLKEGKYEFNNTGYEYNYHDGMFGGPLSEDAYHPHLDYKLSYFREDVGFNQFYFMWHLRYPSWMNHEKYHKSPWFKRGEGFYYTHQQIFARYSLERLANGLPYVEPLYWDQPIKTGYNPRIAHFNGQPFYTRPDNVVPDQFSHFYVKKAKTYEDRYFEAIDAGHFWANNTLYHINNEEGIDILGKAIYGFYDTPNKYYFGPYHYAAMDALGYLVKTSSDHHYIGGPMVCPATSMRDPAFYNYLNRLIWIFQWHKKNFHPYSQKELGFPGVSVKNFVVGKLVTYFDKFNFEITNGMPVQYPKMYSELKFHASQYRLNHKPFTYKIFVNSDNSYEGMVRVFIGPKYDAEGHNLTLEQKRMLMVEFDRFPVKLSSGENIYERNSYESPVFYEDYTGFRHLYNQVNSAIDNKEPFYITKPYTCGVPSRYQLPKGWESGKYYSFYVVVTPFEKKWDGDTKHFHATCGTPKLYDYRPFGFPFDRPLYDHQFNLANIFSTDVPIYHMNEHDINRVQD